MRHILTILAALLLCAAPVQAQTLKSLMYNTTNGQVVYSGTNSLLFTGNVIIANGDLSIGGSGFSGFGSFLDMEERALRADGSNVFSFSAQIMEVFVPITFNNTNIVATTRTNLGLGATWLTNTNVTNFRTAIGLGTNDSVRFADVLASGFETIAAEVQITDDAITSSVNIVVTNQSTASNGLLFVYRTNNEPFLGLANLIASNNTTISNETLFRVGVSEATNKAAQFGFRSTNTNGNGVAVFSVFGFNALMMVGADASTNAVIYSGGGTNNEVMTLIRDGATEFARPLRFSTNASTRPSTNAPANTTNVAAWVEMRIGTNSYRVPLYQ